MKISVIICTYNRERFIKACLEHLYHQDLAKEYYEVIVVNNNCTDSTSVIVDTFITSHLDLSIRQVVEINQGLSYARNRGIREAQYDVISYIDDDGEAEKNWLSSIKLLFESDSNLAGLGGKVIPKYETEEPEWLSFHTRMMVTHIDYGNDVFKCYGKKYPPGCNMSYRKDILKKTKGFNESLKWRVDDKHIFYEVLKVTDEVYFYPQLIVAHNIDEYRVSDESFNILSYRLGQEERLRTKDLGLFSYLFKVFDYTAIYFVTWLYYIRFFIIGKEVKGKYLTKFRWLALKGLLAK